MKRTIWISIVLALTASAMAFSAFNEIFEDNYRVKKGSTLGKQKCLVCHANAKGGKEMNPYGRDIRAAMRAAKSMRLTPAILASVESKDSDGDGRSNIAEIRADKSPGAK